MVTVRVDSVLRGPLDNEIVVNDSAAHRLPADRNIDWRVGDQRVFFLNSSAATVHESVEPAGHFRLTAGPHGTYIIESDKLMEASFTLEEARTALRRR